MRKTRGFKHVDGFNNFDLSSIDWGSIGSAAGAAAGTAALPGAGTAAGAAAGSAIGSAAGGSSTSDPKLDAACGKKPGAAASAAAWKKYNDCKGAYQLHGDASATSAFVWPSETEFPQNKWNALLANPAASAADLQAALTYAQALVTEYQRQVDYHNANNHPNDAKGAAIWRDQAASYVTNLSAKSRQPGFSTGTNSTSPSPSGSPLPGGGVVAMPFYKTPIFKWGVGGLAFIGAAFGIYKIVKSRSKKTS